MNYQNTQPRSSVQPKREPIINQIEPVECEKITCDVEDPCTAEDDLPGRPKTLWP